MITRSILAAVAVIAGTLGVRVAASVAADGERLFLAHCAACHGPGGEGGKGPTLALPSLPRAGTEEQLVRIIRGGISGTGMPSSKLEPDEIRQIAAWVRHLGQRPAEAVPGDPMRGAQLYQERGGCVACHTVAGRGGAVGPDLSDIGLRRSSRHLRLALIDPGADVPQSFSAYNRYLSITENFLQVRLMTKDGRSFVGIRVNEDTFSIQLRDLANRMHSFHKSELAELHKDYGRSPMPSYSGAFTSAELDDLVAYLVSLRGKL